jgi:multisubunit Na+/H+ antiporter MnhB subunit
MAGVPPLLGFVAKETMLEAFKSNLALLAIVFVSAASSAAAAYLLIWDVFFSRPREDLHSHPLPRLLEAGPVLLAVGTVAVALVVTPLLTPLLTPIVPVSFKLVLFPGFTEVFWLSMAVLAAGIIVFLGRNLWRRVPELRVNAAVIFEGLIGGVEWIADQALRSQSGKLRHYLVVVISVVMGILLYGGLATNLFTLEIAPLANLTPLDVVDVMLLGLAIAAATLSIRVRRHLHAVLALGTFGYAVGGVFLVEPAPDVALVQLLVETLATVVLIIMISRVSIKQRAAAMAVNARRWHLTREFLGGSRDILVAGVTGLCMFAFALMALNNVDNRTSIAEWHLENADDEVDATDVVAAIVTDFRGTDTLIEISVFAVSALGLLALLTINRRSGGEPSALSERFSQVSHVATPLVRAVAMVVLPITFMIAAVHILYGASATGDGFTAGVVAGLGVAFYYVVFGYVRVHQQLRWLRPIPILIIGLVIAMVNAWLAVLLDGAFLGYTNFLPELNVANLKLSTTLIFEVGIALAVFGAVSVIMEAIAHPAGIELPEDDADEADGPERTADSQPEAAGD